MASNVFVPDKAKKNRHQKSAIFQLYFYMAQTNFKPNSNQIQTKFKTHFCSFTYGLVQTNLPIKVSKNWAEIWLEFVLVESYNLSKYAILKVISDDLLSQYSDLYYYFVQNFAVDELSFHSSSNSYLRLRFRIRDKLVGLILRRVNKQFNLKSGVA